MFEEGQKFSNEGQVAVFILSFSEMKRGKSQQLCRLKPLHMGKRSKSYFGSGGFLIFMVVFPF